MTTQATNLDLRCGICHEPATHIVSHDGWDGPACARHADHALHAGAVVAPLPVHAADVVAVLAKAEAKGVEVRWYPAHPDTPRHTVYRDDVPEVLTNSPGTTWAAAALRRDVNAVARRAHLWSMGHQRIADVPFIAVITMVGGPRPTHEAIAAHRCDLLTEVSA